MSESPNKLIRFWQELKRRKVFSVVTTYAATAYIIIEVTNNLAVPLHLPNWVATLILLILLIGLPVVIILSWIFDFTPQGIKKTESLEELEGKEIVTKPVKRKLRASYVLNAILIIAVIVLAYPKIFKRDTLEKLRSSGERISVAVMPFQNMTNDTIWNVWQDGIQDNLITSLSNSEELKVRQPESTNSLIQGKGITDYASITPSFANAISQQLDAKIFLYGSINQTGNKLRLNVKLINSSTKEVFKSFQIDGAEDELMPIIDTLSWEIKDFLIMSKLNWEESEMNWEEFSNEKYVSNLPTKSAEAYRCFLYGNKAFDKNDFPAAREWYLKALAIDTNLYAAIKNISGAYYNENMIKDGKEWFLKYYRKLDMMTLKQKISAQFWHATYFETPKESIKYLQQLIDIDDQVPSYHFNLGDCYFQLFQYDKAIVEFDKALEIYQKWDLKPPIMCYQEPGQAYRKAGWYKEEKKLYNKAKRDYPDAPDMLEQYAYVSFSEGDTVEANRYIKKWTSIRKEQSWSDADIIYVMAWIYEMAGMLDKAEDCLRKALSLEPENSVRINKLAYFLIEKDRNINEGLELVEKVLAINPNSIGGMQVKGWGLYKQGKYKVALDLLQKSWDLRMRNAIYNHEVFLHLEAAKKAVAGQKSN